MGYTFYVCTNDLYYRKNNSYVVTFTWETSLLCPWDSIAKQKKKEKKQKKYNNNNNNNNNNYNNNNNRFDGVSWKPNGWNERRKERNNKRRSHFRNVSIFVRLFMLLSVSCFSKWLNQEITIPSVRWAECFIHHFHETYFYFLDAFHLNYMRCFNFLTNTILTRHHQPIE